MSTTAKPTRRPWLEIDRIAVRLHYKAKGAPWVARRLGRTRKAVHDQARKLGLCVPQRFRAPDMVAFVREKNADGWPDAEIARARGVDRHAVAHLRRSLGLPANTFSERRRAAVAEKTREQLERAGLPSIGWLRKEAFRKLAREQGWPEDLPPRCVQMVNAMWERGPMTRRQLADAIGMPWKGSRKSLVGNCPGGSYLAYLIRRGLVTSLGRVAKGKGKGRSQQVYSLNMWAERKVSA